MRWELYPRVSESEHARAWLRMQHLLRLAPKTVEGYGRSLEDYLAFCEREGIEPESAGKDRIALYVNDLASRPNPRGAKVLDIGSGAGLSNATMQLRLTAVRLFYDHLVETGLREVNPVGRGKYTPGKAFAGKRDRGLLRRYRRLPWIPVDDEWRRFLEAAFSRLAIEQPSHGPCHIRYSPIGASSYPFSDRGNERDEGRSRALGKWVNRIRGHAVTGSAVQFGNA
jgi:hypothetical protein